MIKMLRNIAAWFLGEADKLEKLDAKIREAINKQVLRAFYYGAGIGAVLGFILGRGF
jgi:hypothetical protein